MGFPLTEIEHNNIISQIEAHPELIVAVAINTPAGAITKPRPARHGNLISFVERTFGIEGSKQEHGFMTSYGRFVDRAEGARIALENGQTDYVHCPGYLHTEDLWNDPNLEGHTSPERKARYIKDLKKDGKL